MNRKELCRNFQRGSCQYGDRCRFLHTAQPQQPRPNIFGFGHSNQQNQNQKPNPFGFGVQNQPFSNKWTRSSLVAANNNKQASKQGDGQSQQTHQCTDPESCRRQIAEDFDTERPLWKLTCYGHNRGMNCDITGDISYEELRAAGYEDARKGLSLQSIVEKERNLLNAKAMEFDNLRRNPKMISQSPVSAGSSFPTPFNNGTPFVVPQRDAAPSMFGFGRPDASSNVGLVTRSLSSENNIFRQSSQFGVKSEATGLSFGISSDSQVNKVLHSVMPSQHSYSSPFQYDAGRDSQTASPAISIQLLPTGYQADVKSSVNSGDSAIWLKKEWELGEIPEEEPPSQFCY